MQAKQAHPDKVVAVRVGKFYEMVGRDAVVAMELIGLRAMGLSGVPLSRLTNLSGAIPLMGRCGSPAR